MPLDRQSQGSQGSLADDSQGATPGKSTLVQRKEDGATAAPAKPSWTKAEVIKIQTQLKRLGLYSLGIDGAFGPGSESGMVEAFGDESWRTMGAADVLARLTAASPPEHKEGGAAGQHNLRYGEMFKDGLLDMTLGVGFDEGGNHKSAIASFQRVLTARGFANNAGLAAQLYAKAGRAVGPSAFGLFFVRQNALTYKPPAGEARPIHAVVRLVSSADGSAGGQAAQAFKEGMVQSDVAYYSGHGRYGSGPDFDRNMSFELLDAKGEIEQRIEDYEVLESALKAEGAPAGRGPWGQFLWREARKRINVIGTNAGNVFLNPENKHAGEFGSKLMYWNLKRSGGSGAELATGKTGSLGAAAAASPERKYRVLVFDGCRTQDYNTAVRGTKGFDQKSADVFQTSQTLDWGDETDTLASFLDGIIAGQSAEQIGKNMDDQQSNHGAYNVQGLADNPTVK